MNKKDIVKAIAEKLGTSQKEAGQALDAVTEVITEGLARGEKISLIGFGTFEVAERAERMGRNPKTNESMVIKASKAPKFKAGKALKCIVNA